MSHTCAPPETTATGKWACPDCDERWFTAKTEVVVDRTVHVCRFPEFPITGQYFTCACSARWYAMRTIEGVTWRKIGS